MSSLKISVTKTNISCTHDLHEPAIMSSICHPNNIKQSVQILKLKYSSCHFLEFFIAYISLLAQNILLSTFTSRRHCNTFFKRLLFLNYQLLHVSCLQLHFQRMRGSLQPHTWKHHEKKFRNESFEVFTVV
jgi:hypothetical protein